MPGARKALPWVEERNGIYYVYWYAEGSVSRTLRQSLGTKDPVEAQARFAQFLAGGIDQVYQRGNKGLTVSAALDDYYREHVETKVVDKARAADAIKHLKAFFKEELIKNVDIPSSRAYANARRKGIIGGGLRRHRKEGSDASIRRELVVLEAAANHAIKWKRITHSEKPSLEKPAEAPREEIWLTQAEVAVVLGRASGRLKDFLTLLYYTGARRASIERMTRFQVDLRAGRINLSSPKETAIQRASVKRRPIVPIFPEIRPTVERLMQSTSEWLFGDPRDMYRPFVEHLTALELAEKAFPHVMRHSRATHLLQAGVDIYTVARLLGDTVATVERVYGHHSADYLEKAISRGSAS